MRTLITCKEGCERISGNEVVSHGGKVADKGRGWILAQWPDPNAGSALMKNPCFAYSFLQHPARISAASVNSLTEKLMDAFLDHITQKKITAPWHLMFSSADDEQLIQRVKTVEKRWSEHMARKMSRVIKLSRKGVPPFSRFSEGFFVHFISLNEVFAAFGALSAGQQRMQMDPLAPSRSYLKIEEAFHIFGHQPRPHETVIDLGAAPGGWSYSALKRGASVTAIDNGALKGPVKNHRNIKHLTVDALTYKHNTVDTVDWLLCDILETPDLILNLLETWITRKWCRFFVVNLKVGRSDPVLLLKKIRDPQNSLERHCKTLLIRQLYHDREEITLMGQIRG